MANARIIRGKGKMDSKVLIADGFKYHLNNTTNLRYWRCWRKDCRSRLRTNVFGLNGPAASIQIIFDGNNHNHPREDITIEESIAVSEMKDVILNNPTYPIRRVYNEYVARVHQNAGVAGTPPPSIPNFHEISSALSLGKLSNVLLCLVIWVR